MKIFFRKTLELFGWKLVGEFPNIKKSVVIIAPHTSNWDFAIGRFYLNAIGISNNTLMKKELFIFPLNILLNGLGAIPINRNSRKTSVVKQAGLMFKERDELNLFVAPEGTRKKNVRWKKGFYYIATEANVPIVISFIDYKKKEIGMIGVVKNRNSFEETMKEITAVYKSVNAKFPDKFSLDDRISN